jgi:methionine salvage enolase-phosphatase E1
MASPSLVRGTLLGNSKNLVKIWKKIKTIEKLKNIIFYQKYNKWPLKSAFYGNIWSVIKILRDYQKKVYIFIAVNVIFKLILKQSKNFFLEKSSTTLFITIVKV